MLTTVDYNKFFNTLIGNKIKNLKETLEITVSKKVFTSTQIEKRKFTSKINLLKQEIKVQNSYILKPENYTFIIERFLFYVFESMIYNNHTFKIFKIGSFTIFKKTPKTFINDDGELCGSVDMKKSYELKQQLIDEGKTIYHPEKNPKGEKYFIYRTEDYPHIRFKPSMYLDNSVLFVDSQVAFANSLHKIIEQNRSLLNNYKQI